MSCSHESVNMRSVIAMDHEPLHFLQALHGMMVVQTNDYLKAASRLLFEIVGLPYLNQKAREVPPTYSSLTSTGLYLFFDKDQQAFLWMGSEFNSRYNSATQHRRRLISDGLLARLISIYRKEILYISASDE